jgi:hypothetical protein
MYGSDSGAYLVRIHMQNLPERLDCTRMVVI